MRSIILDWLFEVLYIACKSINSETIYLTKRYFDEYLCLKKIDKDELQLLGCVCAWIATKFNEVTYIGIDDFIYLSDDSFEENDMIRLEKHVLNTLKFNIYYVTETTFLGIYNEILVSKQLQENNSLTDSQIHTIKQLSHLFCDLTIIESVFLVYPPSIIAFSSFILALDHLELSSYGHEIISDIQTIDKFDIELFRECSNKLKHLVGQIDTMKLTSVLKYHDVTLTIYKELLDKKNNCT
jgi:hypothetical protein